MLILLVDLILKSNLEEKLLTQRFKKYPEYQQKTGRFIPFL
jgi:steroid 5-alpha reductase family enzyme